jgi:hypothetical protein
MSALVRISGLKSDITALPKSANRRHNSITSSATGVGDGEFRIPIGDVPWHERNGRIVKWCAGGASKQICA